MPSEPLDAEALRGLQAPLKAQYRAEPEAAVVTLSAEGDLSGAGLVCSVDTGRALVEAGLHPASGGDGLSACSGDIKYGVPAMTPLCVRLAPSAARANPKSVSRTRSVVPSRRMFAGLMSR